jgi:hypothetical protein
MKNLHLILFVLLFTGCERFENQKSAQSEVSLICKGTKSFRVGNKVAASSEITTTYKFFYGKFLELDSIEDGWKYINKESKGWAVLIDAKETIYPQKFFVHPGALETTDTRVIKVDKNLIEVIARNYSKPLKKIDGTDILGTDIYKKITINRLSGDWTAETSSATIKLGRADNFPLQTSIKGVCDKSQNKI